MPSQSRTENATNGEVLRSRLHMSNGSPRPATAVLPLTRDEQIVSEPPLPRSVAVLDVPLAVTDYDDTIAAIDAFIDARASGFICVANVHTLMASEEDPELRDALLDSSFNIPDGQPLVWALNALGNSLSERVYGPELMWRYCAHAAKTGTRMYLYGGRNQGRWCSSR